MHGLHCKQPRARAGIALSDTVPALPSVQVYGLPTLMVFKDGALIDNSHREGAITKTILKKYIEDHVLTNVSA